MSGINVPPTWTAKTAAALQQAEQAVAAGMKPNFPDYWREKELRDLLLNIVDYKCWYCEALITRDDPKVDHFRPKSRVDGDSSEYGYWWLAYDAMNYRIACKHCNSGGARINGQSGGRGKGARFPVLGSFRARRPADDYRLEEPVFLDPANVLDASLIGFDANGHARRSARASYSARESEFGVCRADETIRILVLNSDKLTECRRAVMDDVSDYEGWVKRLEAAPESLRGMVLDFQRKIDAKTSITSEFSSAALAASQMSRIMLAGPPSVVESDRISLDAVAPGDGDLAPTQGNIVDLVDLLPFLDLNDLKAGIRLIGGQGGKSIQAKLFQDGRIEFLSRRWGTPTTAARAATGQDDINGWHYWRIEFDGMTMSLEDLKNRLES
ncbi:HNH endonuclease [Streptomyces sp. NPDC090073]|uniref:HNH endonuclease n=1 Tax=Streptomyces sp. NPDC090073 TaxID=3365936 RepID=UPI00380AB737